MLQINFATVTDLSNNKHLVARGKLDFENTSYLQIDALGCIRKSSWTVDGEYAVIIKGFCIFQ